MQKISGRRGSLGTGLYLMGMLTRGYPLPCPVHTEHQWDLSIQVEMIAFGLLSNYPPPKFTKAQESRSPQPTLLVGNILFVRYFCFCLCCCVAETSSLFRCIFGVRKALSFRSLLQLE